MLASKNWHSAGSSFKRFIKRCRYRVIFVWPALSLTHKLATDRTRSRGPTLMGFVAATGLPHLASSQSFLDSRGPVWTTSHLLDRKPSALLASLNNHALHNTSPTRPHGFCSCNHQDTEHQSFRSMCSTVFSFFQSTVSAK